LVVYTLKKYRQSNIIRRFCLVLLYYNVAKVRRWKILWSLINPKWCKYKNWLKKQERLYRKMVKILINTALTICVMIELKNLYRQ
jgi:hypothetical protein